METHDVQQCWLDDAGDLLEAQGTDPGRIFEFHEQIGEALIWSPGGVVETVTTRKEGLPPRVQKHIRRVILRHKTTGELHTFIPSILGKVCLNFCFL